MGERKQLTRRKAERKLTRRDFLKVGGGALASVACMPSLAGCGGNASGKINLRMAWWGSDAVHKSTRKALDLYEKNNPNVTVTAMPSGFPGYTDKITTQIAGGNAPDIVQTSPTMLPNWGRRNALLDLSQFGPDTIRLDQLDNAAVTSGMMNDKLLGIAHGLGGTAQIHNATLLHKAGLQTLDYGYTWDDFAELANEVSEALGEGFYGTADMSDFGTFGLEILVRQRGKELYTEDGNVGFAKQDMRDWFTFWGELRESGAAPPPTVQQEAATLETSLFIQEKVPFYQHFFNNLPTTFQPGIEGKVGLDLMPRYPGYVRPGNHTQAVVIYSGYSGTQYPEEVAKLISFLCTDREAGRIFRTVHGVPPSLETRKMLEGSYSPGEQAVLDHYKLLSEDSNSTPLTITPPEGASELYDTFVSLARDVALGEESINGAVDEWFSEAGRLLG